jgi:hypothetical protein
MKNLLLAPVLALAACVSPGDGQVPIDVDGPVLRTIERVLQRTEAYLVQPPEGVELAEANVAIIEAAVLTARTMTVMPSADGAMLYATMAGLMDFHDAMLSLDLELDPLERDIYLEDTARLRSLFQAVSLHN